MRTLGVGWSAAERTAAWDAHILDGGRVAPRMVATAVGDGPAAGRGCYATGQRGVLRRRISRAGALQSNPIVLQRSVQRRNQVHRITIRRTERQLRAVEFSCVREETLYRRNAQLN